MDHGNTNQEWIRSSTESGTTDTGIAKEVFDKVEKDPKKDIIFHGLKGRQSTC
jgi:hypothetical protein